MPKRPHAVVFFLSLGLMLYELCLTRVLSAIFYYHTAFLALSVAFLGLGLGALFAGRLRFGERIQADNLLALAGITATLFPYLADLLSLGQDPGNSSGLTSVAGDLGITIASTSLPFFFGGLAMAGIFRTGAKHFASLYALDLLGAGLGTLLMIPVMEFMPGSASLVFAAFFLWLSAVLSSSGKRWIHLLSLLTCLMVALLLTSSGTVNVPIKFHEQDHDPATGLPPELLFEKWNAFSRVAVIANAGWDRGLSQHSLDSFEGRLPEQREALIDVNAFAAMVKFDGDLEKVALLRETVSNLGYRVARSKPRVAIIGPGGGKDVLGAVLFDASEILGIEINSILVDDLVLDQFRDFCGDIYRNPKVKIIVGDGRSELQRLDGPFDIIIANSVATWSAQGTGAMNLTEHQIFTQEAFELYREKLSPEGIFSISLWDEAEHSVPLRLISTWLAASRGETTEVAMISNPWDETRSFATLLMKRGSFSAAERAILADASRKFEFEIGYLRDFENESIPMIVEFMSDPKSAIESSDHDLSPASDDRPFAFYTLRSKDALAFWRPMERSDNAAYVSLVLSFFLVLVLVALMLSVTFHLGRRQNPNSLTTVSETLYFGLIGFAFMTMELGLIHKLTLILGHPVYSLTMGLGGLLVWTGISSRLSRHLESRSGSATGLRRLVLLVALALAVFSLVLLPFLQPLLIPMNAVGRLMAVFFLLSIPGLAMGLPMPLALGQLRQRSAEAIPTAFGVNCAMTVLATVTTILVAVLFGFQSSLVVGVLAYVLAAMAAGQFRSSAFPEPDGE